jgi:uncharacterized protein (DUF58 family)
MAGPDKPGLSYSTQPRHVSSPVAITIDELIALRHDAERISLSTAQLRARLSGNYSARFKGRGMEFDQVRPYVDGDDIRMLDWKVTARTNKPHTKLYREERERPVQVFVDYRRMMFFATRGMFKAVWASQAAALIGWAAANHRDRLGGLIISEHKHEEIKPQNGAKAVLRFIKHMVDHPAWKSYQQMDTVPQNDTFYQGLMRLRRVTKPGSFVFIMSDFRDFDWRCESAIAQIARHNNVVLVFCYDPIEAELPPAGFYRFSSGQSEWEINTGDRKVRTNYHSRFQERFDKVAGMSGFSGIHFLKAETREQPLAVLETILKRVK